MNEKIHLIESIVCYSYFKIFVYNILLFYTMPHIYDNGTGVLTNKGL